MYVYFLMSSAIQNGTGTLGLDVCRWKCTVAVCIYGQDGCGVSNCEVGTKLARFNLENECAKGISMYFENWHSAVPTKIRHSSGK